MPHLSRWIAPVFLVGLVGLEACATDVGGTPEPQGWTYYGGDKAFTRYAPLDQINRENVADVEVLWRRAGVDASITEAYPDLQVSGTRRLGNLRSTPILVDGVLYAPNGVGLVEAFEPGTGETIWVQEPFAPTLSEVAGMSSRGLDYWTDGTDRRLVLVKGGYLYTLDPETGQTDPDFGEGGRVDLVRPPAERFSWTSGPIVARDVVVIAGTFDGAGDSGNRWRGSQSEDIRGYDVRTGRLLWTFHVVPGGRRVRCGDLGGQVLGVLGRPGLLVLPQRRRGARVRVRSAGGPHVRLLRRPSRRRQPLLQLPRRSRR